MLNLSPTIARIRGIKGYKNKAEDRLLSAFKASELLKESAKSFDDTKPKMNLFKARIEKIREKLKEFKKNKRG